MGRFARVNEAEGDDDEDVPERPAGDRLAAHPGHEFGQIRGTKKGSTNIPSVVGDGPVSVRGPDERQLAKDTSYLLAIFNYRDRERAQNARNDLLSGKFGLSVPKVDGPRAAKQGEQQYFTLSAVVDVPEDKSPNELIRGLRSRKAADVQGPFKRAGQRRFELTVQKRSGATETRFYSSEQEANQAKAEIEKGIKDSPVKGVVARRMAPGQSSLTQRGMTKGQYFSDTAAKSRKHWQLLKDDPDGARSEIARDQGLTLAIEPGPGEAGEEARMEREILRQKVGPERASREISAAKEQLDAYIKKVKDQAGGQARTAANLEKLKPQFDGSFVGQTHTVKGRAQTYRYSYLDPKTGERKKGSGQREGQSNYEFVWDGKQWLTPVEYHSARRGERMPTQQAKGPEAASAGGSTAAPPPTAKAPTRGGTSRRLDPTDRKYAEKYAETLQAVGRHYMQSPLTTAMGEAMLGVVRTTRAKGSPTKQSLELLSRSIEELRADFETRGNAMTPRGRENVERAIHAGYLCLSQPPPTHDDYGSEDDDEPDPQGFAKAAADAARLGLARSAGTPKSIGKGFTGDPRQPGRKHVAVAPGLPPKVVDTVPHEYLRTTEPGWEELDWMLRGEDDSTFAEPKDSSAWQALKSRLGDRLTRHAVPGVTRKGPDKGGGGQGGEERDDSDTPWRALAKLKGRVPDK